VNPRTIPAIRRPGLLSFVILLAVVSCATLSSRPELFRAVRNQPGQVAWSPDSRTLALASGGDLVLVDLQGRILQTLEGVNPVFVNWAPGSDLIVVHGPDGAGRRLSRWEVGSGDLQAIGESPGARAAFPVGDDRGLAVLSLSFQKMSVGSFADMGFTLAEGARTKELGSVHTNLPPGATEDAYLAAWTLPGLRPFHETLLRPQYRKPPMFPPYTLLDTLDPLTGEVTQIIRLNLNRYGTPLTWSPDGRFLAFTDDSGYLNILDATSGDEPVQVSAAVKGLYPSWHPMRKVLCFGGRLVTIKGKVLNKMDSSGEESIGTWSPDGLHLALVDRDGLRVVSDIRLPEDVEAWELSPDMEQARDRLRSLKDLYRKNLISIDEYKSRREKHMKVLAP